MTNPPPDPPASSIVFFDGVCGLCNGTVKFLLRIDRKGVLRFSPLQGRTAAEILGPPRSNEEGLKSIVFVEDPGVPAREFFLRSEAVLRILVKVGGFWRMAGGLLWIPRAIRDGIYDWIARRRYRWFGRFRECPLPPPEWRSRFLP